MLILSVCHGGHDSSAVVADDYEILSAVQTERIARRTIRAPTDYSCDIISRRRQYLGCGRL